MPAFPDKTASSPGGMHSRLRLYLVCFLLIAVTGLAYRDIDKCGFLRFDDQEYVYENPNVVSGPSAANVKWAFTTFTSANWHPVTWLSHMLDCRMFGLKPAGHHLVNLAFHILNVLLLFIVLRSMTGALWRSALVAALFALHPLHVESVAWISERKDLLCTFFMLLSLFSYSRYVSGKKFLNYFFALFLFAVGLMAKPMIVTLPFVMLLLDAWPLGRFTFKPGFGHLQDHYNKASVFLEKTPFFLLSLASCVVTVIAQRNSNALMDFVKHPFTARLANAALSYTGYLKKFFWPVDLSFFYPLSGAAPVAGKLLAAVLALVLISVIAIAFFKKRPWLAVGWFWFLGTLVPVIGIVQVGNQAMADRYLYIPLIGPAIVVAWLLGDFAVNGRAIRIAAASAAAAALVLLALQTGKQAAYWKNDESLADHALVVSRDNYLACSMKGACLLKRNEFDKAKQYHQRALSLFPGMTVSRLDLSYIDLVQGNDSAAIANAGILLAGDSLNVLANHVCGLAYAGLNDFSHAEACFNRALKKDPGYVPGLSAMRLVRERKKSPPPATNYFQTLSRKRGE
jgi:tetratricopeptide (TPR) repeat protein